MIRRPLTSSFIGVVKKTFRLFDVFFATTPYTAIPFPERIYEKRYKTAISADLMARSALPLPMETPTSAAARAVASFMPSPAMMVGPRDPRALTISTFCAFLLFLMR
jgi:hypothetical protein